MEYTVLLNAPDEPLNQVQVAKLGDFKDKRYGEFSITPGDVESWQTNLARLPGGEALIDLEHGSERSPRNSEAAGWITGLKLDGDKVMADVRWTSLGEQKIRDGRYRFMSPTYGPYRDETGQVHDNTLVSAALTNKPFLGSMPAVSLASEERVSEALGAELTRLLDHAEEIALTAEQQATLRTVLDAAGPSDSRRTMDAQTLKLLGLDENADDKTVLETITALQAKADQEPAATETKTLEQQAEDAGKRLLDQDLVKQLVADAAAGREASDALKAEKFDRAFTTALEAGRAVPAQRERYEGFYKLDADSTLQMLEDAPPIVNVKPAAAAKELTADTIADLPLEQQLPARIDLKAKELGCDYETAYLKVLDEIEGKS